MGSSSNARETGGLSHLRRPMYVWLAWSSVPALLPEIHGLRRQWSALCYDDAEVGEAVQPRSMGARADKGIREGQWSFGASLYLGRKMDLGVCEVHHGRKLHQPRKGKQWFSYAVEGVLTPEEVLKRQMASMGMEGERFDFITFEGAARALPRRIRSTLAHLHVALGHLSNERLARMLSLSGGGKDLLNGAQHLRCQVCCMVRPPQATPQVSYSKPTNFNQRISGDCFHIWDVKGLRYTVVHFIDDLTDYQIGGLTFEANANFVAKVLRLKWYDVFGPPDILVTDGGREFQGHIVYLNELFAVRHEVVPDQAKWRLGHAERHGAVLKIMMMKVVQSLRIDTVEEMTWALTSAIAAKNRLVNDSGISPLQAVTGRNTPLPASLLAQITSGKIKFKTNEELDKDDALRRAERVAWCTSRTPKGVGQQIKTTSFRDLARRECGLCVWSSNVSSWTGPTPPR